MCTANLYRSPLAEYLLRRRVEEAGTTGLRISSAGTRARPGAPLPASAVHQLAQVGGADFAAGFVSRRLDPALVAEADLVLGLAHEHREAAARLHPASLRRCFTVAEFLRLSAPTTPAEASITYVAPVGTAATAITRAVARRGRVPALAPELGDIADPVAGPDDALQRCAAQIEAAVESLAEALLPTP